MGKVAKNLRSCIHLTLNQRKKIKRWNSDLKTLVQKTKPHTLKHMSLNWNTGTLASHCI